MSNTVVPLFDYRDVRPSAALHASVTKQVEALRESGRVTVEHEPLVALAFRLADALESSSGRGASVALLSAQFQAVWERLAALPMPAGDVDTTMDVYLAPVEAPGE